LASPSVLSNSHKKNKESHNVKKIPFVASQLSFLLVAFLALSSFALAHHKTSSWEQDDRSNLAKLVLSVRKATVQYQDINKAISAGYGPLFGCVSGTDHGAMGIHYVNPSLLNGTIDVTTPQALIYEPSNGQMKLVGVEFIADAATWLKTHSAPPVLEGQVFTFVDAPNRFTINSFFELHVWAWRENPQGPFVDWNDHVSCAGDPGE
jgi:hypothetical protein